MITANELIQLTEKTVGIEEIPFCKILMKLYGRRNLIFEYFYFI